MRSVLEVTACVLLVAGCAGLERDSSVYYVWAKRGQSMGDLAHTYCVQGGVRERAVFRHAMEDQAGRVKVVITCVEPPP